MAAKEGTLPRWHWAYAVFKFGDGATHALFPLAVLLVYGQPIWVMAAVTAGMNLAGIPSAFAWARFMERGRGRRRAAVIGFAVSAASLAVVAFTPPLWLFALMAVLFVAFGTATAPAASILALEGVPRRKWGAATGALSRRTGYAFLAGLVLPIALGLAGLMDFSTMFAVGAAFAAVAAFLAHRTIAPFDPLVHGPRKPAYDASVVREGQRRFERALWFPTRLLFRPTFAGIRAALSRGPARLLLAIGAMFFASVAFFASYPGVLSRDLGLDKGLVLLGQAPASFLTPMTYRAAGRYADRHGKAHGLRIGVGLRLVALPLFCASILFLGSSGFWLFLVFHAMLGVSFAFLQVNGPLIAATLHPRGHGEGVGAYHATMAVGTLAGSATAAILLAAAPLYVSYVVAVVVLLLAGWLASSAVARHRRVLQPE